MKLVEDSWPEPSSFFPPPHHVQIKDNLLDGGPCPTRSSFLCLDAKGSNPVKKLLPFGHFPKVALTPPRFGHLWGNFRLNRLRKKHTTKNYLKTT